MGRTYLKYNDLIVNCLKYYFNHFKTYFSGTRGSSQLFSVCLCGKFLFFHVLHFDLHSKFHFQPASLVTPLGALSVIVAAILSSHYLNERLNLLGKLGCFLCIIGSTIIVIHSPKEVEIESLDLLKEKLTDTSFIVYVVLILSVTLFMALYVAPKYGHKNVSIYIIICSAIGSLTVMSCKALGLAMRDSFSGKSNDFGTALPYMLIVLTVIFIGIQMTYLNKGEFRVRRLN